MFADLPVSLADPVERLATVRAQMQDLKESQQAVAGSTLTSLGGFAPAMLLALAGRVATRTPQHAVTTVTTNVPGPQHAIYLAGHRMLEYFPFVPLGGHVRYLDHFTWSRIVGWLRKRHLGLNCGTLSRRYLPGWEIRDGRTEMFRPRAETVTRYRHRGSLIPTPWTETA